MKECLPNFTGAIIDDGRWAISASDPFGGNVLTLRHDGMADVGFVDGHVNAVTWRFGANRFNTQPSL